MTSSPALFLIAGVLATACAPVAASPPVLLGSAFVLAPAQPPAGEQAPATGAGPASRGIGPREPAPAATTATAIASTGPPPAVPASGGGSGLAAPPPPPATGGTLVLPDGRTLAVVPGDEVPLPAGLTGEASLIVPGRVPATIDLPGAGLPVLALHPRDASVPALPADSAHVVGSVVPGDPGVAVQFVSATRGPLPGTTTGTGGAYAMDVPTDGADQGLLVARDATEYPRLGLQHIAIAPGEAGSTPNLDLVDPGPAPIDPPVPPAGMAITAAGLFEVEGTGETARRVKLLAVPGDRLPGYDLPGFTLGARFLATAADGQSASESSGAPGALPAFLDPPDLSATGRPAAGVRLGWGAATGASLYTVRVGRALTPDPPLWEAATARTGVTLPAGLALDGADLLVQVDAWDAPEVTIYSVASIRRLKVPAEPPGAAGRHSVALRRFAP